MRCAFHGAAALLCVMLAACGGRPEGVLRATGLSAASGSTVDLVAVTTRQETDAPGVLFSGERSRYTSLTEIKVSIPPEAVRTPGEVQWPKMLPPDPATEFATVSVNRLSPTEARTWFRGKTRTKRHVLLFVHGFNNTYEDAVYRFAQIHHDSKAQAVPILFTWPSRGSVLSYAYDRESTAYSRDALEEALQALADEPSVGDVSVLAHSMGSFLAMESLRQMAIRKGRIAPKIRHVILAAPDVDIDVFRRQLGAMGPAGSRPSFTIFTSTDDRALKVSSRIAGAVPRLGQIDPDAEPYKSEFAAADVEALDLTAVETPDKLKHGKFASANVVRSIGERLVAGQKISDDRVSFGQRVGQLAGGVAAGAGAAAGAIVSAPLAIVDPDTRRGYGDQLGAIGVGIGDAASSFEPDVRRRRAAGGAPPAAVPATRAPVQPATASSTGSSPSNSTLTR